MELIFCVQLVLIVNGCSLYYMRMVLTITNPCVYGYRCEGLVNNLYANGGGSHLIREKKHNLGCCITLLTFLLSRFVSLPNPEQCPASKYQSCFKASSSSSQRRSRPSSSSSRRHQKSTQSNADSGPLLLPLRSSFSSSEILKLMTP